jgi:hypothetical protein
MGCSLRSDRWGPAIFSSLLEKGPSKATTLSSLGRAEHPVTT